MYGIGSKKVTEMNQEERRSLKILQDEGYKIDETEFRRWCEGKKAYFNSSAGSLWCNMRADKIALEWKSEYE